MKFTSTRLEVFFSRGFLLCICCRSALGTVRGRPTTPTLDVPADVQHLWAQYSPFFPVAVYSSPRGCQITQVNILQRHGARFPTASAGEAIQSAVAKLQSVKEFKNSKLDFLHSFVYDLGTEDLVSFGAAQSFDAGQLAVQRYGFLIDSSQLPFVRSSSTERVVLSATNWTTGMCFASGGLLQPVLSTILSESANDTLDDVDCPDAGSADAQTNAWQGVYAAPIAKSLNADAPGANLSVVDISNLISLCPFETVAKAKASPWCELFSIADFQGFEYFGDLNKFYGTGYGQELGPVQGVGYVNELIARLTGNSVQDQTTTNSTLDSSPLTFPLNRTMYADFSHDNELIAIYSALGLFKPAKSLDPLHPDPRRKYLASQLVPFSGQLVTERLECGGIASVRMLVDDAVQPLEFCNANGEGICSLKAFVESQSFSRSNGDGFWQKCFT